MDTKTPLLPQSESTMLRRPSSRKLRRFHIAAFIAVLGLFWLGWTWQCPDPSHNHGRAEESKVPLEIHIMSKCPDARDCLQNLVLPTMQKVSDKVDFRLSFIGKTTDEDDGVQCMHGQTECLGNILELCAAHVYPDPKIYLGFTMCMSRNFDDIPKKDLVEDCALEHGMDFDKINHCVSQDDGAYAMDLLRKSVERSAEANVTKSCTVRLNNKVRCIMDGGDWSECEGGSKPEDLERDIKSLYDASRGWAE
ncbi:hypothetical protein GQ43DRAFT_428762 [Delitschia confertaspora ATCC 74209]|uniref:Gamma interferon inducible lysosomal thiol reductase (GILT) n=1 Tax=Delitschia confertaspora ATCC 74209 TaxID=1513339 RepID=A0A9P4JY58_9PLEO|nr:hypothetical protein GQ43DRAFT_428762 [Delitschia confertaspora ATCC 74209]